VIYAITIKKLLKYENSKDSPKKPGAKDG